MSKDHTFALNQFNDSLLSSLTCLINDSFRDSWRSKPVMEYLKIEVEKLLKYHSSSFKLEPELYKTSEWNAPNYPFGPAPIKSLVSIDLSENCCTILENLSKNSLTSRALNDFRFRFYISFQIFLQNCHRGSTMSEVYLAGLQINNPLILDLLNDHCDKPEINDTTISKKTIQKKAERYFIKNSFPTSRNDLFQEILDPF